MPYFNFDLVIGEDFKNQGGCALPTQTVTSSTVLRSTLSRRG